MNAKPIVKRVLETLKSAGLEAILIGNAAAALQGAPVTTDDIDFLIRRTPRNAGKIRVFAQKLDGIIERPAYPLSDFWRISSRKGTPIQIDLATSIHGIRSFESLRSRADQIDVNGEIATVAHLADVIKSKRAADRPKDRAVLPVLEATLREKNQKTNP
jgi:predicted nucleotidyltransferase